MNPNDSDSKYCRNQGNIQHSSVLLRLCLHLCHRGLEKYDYGIPGKWRGWEEGAVGALRDVELWGIPAHSHTIPAQTPLSKCLHSILPLVQFHSIFLTFLKYLYSSLLATAQCLPHRPPHTPLFPIHVDPSHCSRFVTFFPVTRQPLSWDKCVLSWRHRRLAVKLLQIHRVLLSLPLMQQSQSLFPALTHLI